ncbi:MAG: hypothetical protein ACKOW1_00590 [Novosphingobium sp.]|jgi:hypothetical protein
MTGLFFALLATLLVGFGARDQLLVAQLAERQGARPALLLVAAVSAAVTAGLAALAGAEASTLLAGTARLFLVTLAVALAGLELLALSPRPAPAEPTHSLGAFALVILTTQLADAPRFIIFALAALTRAPVTTAMGGAVGGALIVAAGWSLSGALASPRIVRLRRGRGAFLLLLALVVAVLAMRGG